MSILDRWEEKAVRLTRRASEKAQCLTETSRLHSLIAGEEKNYHSLCTQIGEQYVKLHAQDYEPQFEELMNLCKESLERKENYVLQIQQIRKVRTCPSCGCEVPIDFAYCNFCGVKLPEVEAVIPRGSRKCPGCGAVIPESMKFCNHCGTEQPVAEEDGTQDVPSDPVKEAEIVLDAPETTETPETPQEDSPAQVTEAEEIS